MTTIYKNDYLSFSFDEEHRILFSEWTTVDKSHLEDDDEAVKAIMLKGNELRKQYLPKFYLADERQRMFAYNNDIQEWMGTEIGKNYLEIGLQKCAILLPEEFIANLSTTLTADEATSQFETLKIAYFVTNEEAMAWFRF